MHTDQTIQDIQNRSDLTGIWETIRNPKFNSGEFAIIRSQAGLNSYKLSVNEVRA